MHAGMQPSGTNKQTSGCFRHYETLQEVFLSHYQKYPWGAHKQNGISLQPPWQGNTALRTTVIITGKKLRS